LESDDDRWDIRAAVDAVIAEAYGLIREDYEYLLTSFPHTSYPPAPLRCLKMFDELKSIGLQAFTERHDPYFDIPLNDTLPRPVIDLPIPAESHLPGFGDLPLANDGAGVAVPASEGSHVTRKATRGRSRASARRR
jgi:hypothetical protein